AAPATAANQQASAKYSDSLLNAYIMAAYQVNQVHQEMTPQIQAAASDEQKAKLLSSMQQEMMGIVQKSDGITLQQYSMITQEAQQ
ncbi:DUF4168 domain-containing protein, partial [bacterium LRH843]|nr:DUF4168 domain-containing protein [bacterium LRH843]